MVSTSEYPELKLLSGQYETLTRLDRYFLSQFLPRKGKINHTANIDQGISTPATMCTTYRTRTRILPSNPTFLHATTELVFKVCQCCMTLLGIKLQIRHKNYSEKVVSTNMQNYILYIILQASLKIKELVQTFVCLLMHTRCYLSIC